jgi:hypothetical protein
MGIGDHVQSGFGHDGWDAPEEYGQFRGDGGGGGGGGNRGPYRFKLPEPGKNPFRPGKAARKRVMIISVPFYLWEHGTYKVNSPKGVFNAICLKQNRIQDRCALCDAKTFPSYGAYFTVIDMGYVEYEEGGAAILYPEPWTDKDGKPRESQFQRRLMVAKKGGKDRPGTMFIFEDHHARRGDLTGCVFDTQRLGKQSPANGENWEFVERVGKVVPATVEDMKQYLMHCGATQEQVDKENLFQRYTIRDMEEGLLFSNEDMITWTSGDSGGGRETSGGQGQGRNTRTEGAGYGGQGQGRPQGQGQLPLGGARGGCRPDLEEEDQFKGDEDFRGGVGGYRPNDY